MLKAPTTNPRWRVKPCTHCGTQDWMFGRKHLCTDCQDDRDPMPAKPTKYPFPEDAFDRMRDMRSLGACWRIIALGFGCNRETARDFYRSNDCDRTMRLERLRKLLRIAEREMAA